MPRTVPKDHFLVGFLTELARLLIEVGIGAHELERVIQVGFVRAASKDARLRNTRINQSAIAAMTGLTRPQVRGLLRRHLQQDAKRVSSVGDLLAGWVSDPDFYLSEGKPRTLMIRGKTHSFSELVRRYGAGVTPRALQAELVRRGLAKISDGKIRLMRRVMKPDNQERQLERLLNALAMAMRSPRDRDGSSQVGVLSKEISFSSVNSVSKVLLKRRVRQSMDAFTHNLETAISAISDEQRRKKNRSRMSKMSVVVIAHD
ncbi:MAG: DUF6502 family protein [Steroidobacteraceae bacterium]